MKTSIATRASRLLLLIALCSFNTNAQLVANFTASPVKGCAPLVTNFTDQSTGNPT